MQYGRFHYDLRDSPLLKERGYSDDQIPYEVAHFVGDGPSDQAGTATVQRESEDEGVRDG